MLLVVADTGPIRYLVEIGHIGLLPRLFGKLFIPSAVFNELRNSAAPSQVRRWADAPPRWLEVLPVTATEDPAFQSLDEGEKAALTLGMTLGANLILIDDRKGAAAALQKGFEVTGTLGVLTRASQLGLVDLKDVFERLKATNFHYSQKLLDEILKKYPEGGNL